MSGLEGGGGYCINGCKYSKKAYVEALTVDGTLSLIVNLSIQQDVVKTVILIKIRLFQ